MTNEIACDITKLSSEELKQVNNVAKEVFANVTELKVLPNGYAMLFLETQELFEKLSYIIKLNRACCPFLRQVLIADPYNGAIWLEFTGEKGVKEMLAMDLSGLLPKQFVDKLELLAV